MDALTLVLLIGLVGRGTILITRDVITEPFRAWVKRRWPGKQATVDTSEGPLPVLDENDQPVRDDSKLYELITCHWCTSVWVSGAAVPFAYYAGDTLWFIIPATIATASFAASLLSDR